MKIIIYSDPQIKNHPEFLSIGSDGLSNWILIAIDCFNQMLRYAVKNKIDFIVGLGDMCEMKNHLDNSILVIINRILNKIASYSIIHYWVVGNHDYSNPNFPLLGAFNGIKNFMIFAARAFSPNKLWAILPYTDNNEEIIDFFNDLIINNVNPPYLFTHNVIVKPDNNEFLNAAFDKDDPALKKYKLIFSGHVHKPQQIGNVVYVGSMYQTDFGEADEQKRFCVLDPDTGIYESINFAYPELINVNGSEISEDKACDNYIKFKIKLSAKERAPNIRSIIENALVKGALDVKVVIERDKPIRKIRLTKEQIKSNTFENLVELYCNQHKLNYDDIIDYSKLLMANV